MKNQALLERIALALEQIITEVRELTKEYRDLAGVINPPFDPLPDQRTKRSDKP